MNRIQAEELVKKYNAGIASKAEINLLEHWYAYEAAEQHKKSVENVESVELGDEDYLEVSREMWKNIEAARGNVPVKRLWPKYVAAACMLLCLGSGIFYSKYLINKPKNDEQQALHDIAPGKNAATLTLANGKQILLTDSKNGKIATQAGSHVTKTAEGRLIYKAMETDGNTALIYNTLTTARGQQYELIMPDGTHVWLNAETTIKFPASFENQTVRSVELSGQAYFEVKKDAERPFIVISAKQKVKVLGTHFDVCDYPGEALRTTLLEGAVSVSRIDNAGNTWNTRTLKPGQQSVLAVNAAGVEVIAADTEHAIAWKNGFFQFDNADVNTVMRQLSRWYDVKVEYKGAIPEELFSGKVYRNMSLSKVLEVLSFSQVNFEIKGRKMIIHHH